MGRRYLYLCTSVKKKTPVVFVNYNANGTPLKEGELVTSLRPNETTYGMAMLLQ